MVVPFYYLFTSLPAKVLAPQNLFSICHFTTNQTFVWCARLPRTASYCLQFQLSAYISAWRTAFHCVCLRICKLFNRKFISILSTLYHTRCIFGVGHDTPHKAHSMHHIVHCVHWPSFSRNNCRIIVVVSVTCWVGAGVAALPCRYQHIFI